MTLQRSRSVYIVLLAAAWVIGSCGSDSSQSRVSFDVMVSATSGKNLANDYGYTITFTAAKINLGPIHFFSGEPLFTQKTSTPSFWRWARNFFWIREAHAHPGHYQEGDAMAEVLKSATVDLLSGKETLLGTADGVTGTYRSAQITLAKSTDNGGHTVVASGEAKKGTETIKFSAVLDLDDKIKGIASSAEVKSEKQKVTIVVDLATWAQRIDFSAFAGKTGTVALESGSQAQNAFFRGVFNTSGFKFNWSKSAK